MGITIIQNCIIMQLSYLLTQTPFIAFYYVHIDKEILMNQQCS